jgi:hypothetical protein
MTHSPIGTHASGPVQTSATAGSGIGSQGTTLSNAGNARSGERRQAGTSAAAAVAIAPTHHGAAIASRIDAESGAASDIRPAAHQTATPMQTGPTA